MKIIALTLVVYFGSAAAAAGAGPKPQLGFEYEHSYITGQHTWGINDSYGINRGGQSQPASLNRDLYKLALKLPARSYTLSGYIGKETWTQTTDQKPLVSGTQTKMDGVAYGVSVWIPLFR
jgi:hypothetical protein